MIIDNDGWAKVLEWKCSRAQIPRKYYMSAGLWLDCILFIVAVKLIVCFSLLATSFSENFSWFGARSTIQLVRSALLSSPLTTFLRVLSSFLAHCLAIFFSYSFLPLLVSIHVYFYLLYLFFLLRIRRFIQASEDQYEGLRGPKIISLCRAVGLSSFILPASLSCSHHQPFFCDFLHLASIIPAAK